MDACLNIRGHTPRTKGIHRNHHHHKMSFGRLLIDSSLELSEHFDLQVQVRPQVVLVSTEYQPNKITMFLVKKIKIKSFQPDE